VAAGVAAIGSFLPPVYEHRVIWGLILIVVLVLGNLRGVREAGLLFSAPTYIYLMAIGGLIAYGITMIVLGAAPPAAQPPTPFEPTGTEALGILLILRAFSSGSVALTGAEAI